MSIITKSVLSDQIIDVLRKRVIAGAFGTDSPIRQDALAAELGVSKIPLREAFAKLEQEGLIVSRANRGYFVSPFSLEEALDVFDLRMKLEPSATAEASARVDNEKIEIARRALDDLNDAIGAKDPKSGALNRAFHVALVRPCRRPVTIQLIERLHCSAERYIVRHLDPNGRNARALVEHTNLFEAWAAGDRERTEVLAAEHIEASRDDLVRELRFDEPSQKN